MTTDDLSEFHTIDQLEELRVATSKMAGQLREAKNRTAVLEAAVREGTRDAILSLGPLPKIKAPAVDKRTGSEHVTLWDFGDWQGAKITPSYNSDVMKSRVMLACDKAIELTYDIRSKRPVRTCVIIFGGDMIEGLFNFPTQVYEIDQTIFGQWTTVSRLMIDVVRYALSVYDKVVVVPEWGNHGRIGSKRAAVPKNDNIDRMCFEFARSMLESEERLVWPDCPEDIQRLEVGNYRALVIHGDEIGRNGYASPATIVSHVAKWQSGAYKWKFRDCYVHHYHNHAEQSLPNGEGSVYFTGSTESDNRYARDTMAASAIPSQRVQFVDPDRGLVVSSHKLWLQEAA